MNIVAKNTLHTSTLISAAVSHFCAPHHKNIRIFERVLIYLMQFVPDNSTIEAKKKPKYLLQGKVELQEPQHPDIGRRYS